MPLPQKSEENAQRGDNLRINHEIRSSQVRLIDQDGEMIGVVSLSQALHEAESRGLDLVEISPQASPPVCKVLDYGRYKYDQQKKKTEARKKQKTVEVKEIQVRPMINDHDFDVKCKAIQRFLGEGDRVKITLRFRGRELSHQSIGIAVLERIKKECELLAKIEFEPKLEGKQLIMIFSPKA